MSSYSSSAQGWWDLLWFIFSLLPFKSASSSWRVVITCKDCLTSFSEYVVQLWKIKYIIAPDKDWKQLGIYPPLFGLIGYFKFLHWVAIWKQINKQWNPDFLLTFGLIFRKPTDKIAKYIWDCYFRFILKIQRIYQVIYDSLNLQRSI